MRQAVLLSAYRPPAWRVDAIALTFDLAFEATEVAATLTLTRDADAGAGAPLRLDGEHLELIEVARDGVVLAPDAYQVDETGLTLAIDADAATITTRVRLRPQDNTALEGLYRSGRFLLTQCEAQGFRRITYFPDRPDVMARYRVTLRADRTAFPVLLANGNPVESGPLPDGRHYAVWDDPHRKPSYLFAIAAGELAVVRDTFLTRDGRDVRLAIYAEADAIDRCAHAMASVRHAMAWDEQHYGRAYDLDEFNIVATHDFNMGAMENKGLNIFNAKYIVADVDTATDDDFENVAAVVAHEYFHNWTGNRITCRDWFQLSLKEGLTVFRDQQFSADHGSRAVHRIDAVRQLRTLQFAEDAGPFAHPVRPDRYVEINNFYTATVYEKGAEIIRMMHTVLGPERFRRGMDLYFARHDGQAVTCDDFRRALSDGSGVDLEAFATWYTQAGTPQLHAAGHYDAARREYVLTLSQSTPPTPGQPEKRPVPIPVRMMLYARDGRPMPMRLAGDADAHEQRVVVLHDAQARYVFTGLDEAPVASLLQDFSAPVTLVQDRDAAELAFLARHDRDPFNRWQAMHTLAEQAVGQALVLGDAGPGGRALVDAARALLADDALDPAFIAECLTLPEQGYLADRLDSGDPEALHAAHHGVRARLGVELGDALRARFDRSAGDDGRARDGVAIARRRLRNTALSLLMAADPVAHAARAQAQFESAGNMTDRLAALTVLVHRGVAGAQALVDAFEQRYRHDPLVLDKWLALQASSPQPGTLARVAALVAHPVFSWRNPNKVRALLTTFARSNRVAFHARDGAGYRFVGAAVATLDPINPQVAARLVAAFNGWRRLEPARRALMQDELARLAALPSLSPDVGEIVARALA